MSATVSVKKQFGKEARVNSDETEIINLLNLYGTAIDALQLDLFDLVFTSDVRAEYPNAAWENLETFKRDFLATHAPFDTTQHTLTNHQVVVRGDEANALCYGRARLMRTVPEGGSDFWETGCWYDDVLVRTSRGWRIKDRLSHLNWWEGNVRVLEYAPGIVFRPYTRPLRKVADQLRFLSAVRARP